MKGRLLIGYARFSMSDHELDLQLDALKKARCNKIFTDKAKGAMPNRPGLEACLKELKKGDVLLVWRLDRLGRSMVHLVSLLEQLQEKGVGFRSICDGTIDTTTAYGEVVFNIFSSLARFERQLIQERTRPGLDAARSRGRKGGRRPIQGDHPKVKMAKKMALDKSLSIGEICASLKISKATFYRYLSLPPDLNKCSNLFSDRKSTTLQTSPSVIKAAADTLL